MNVPSDMPEKNRITQMQIDEFAKSMRAATGSELAICIIEDGDILQAAIQGSGDEGEAEGRMAAIRALCCVAGASLEEATEGAFKLLIRMPDGTLEAALPEQVKAQTVSRHG